MGLAILKSIFTGLPVQNKTFPKPEGRFSPFLLGWQLSGSFPPLRSLSVTTSRTTCTHSLLHNSFTIQPTHPFRIPSFTVPPSLFPQLPLPKMVPDISSISVPRAFYPRVPHRTRGPSRLRPPIQTPTECSHKGPTRPVSRDRDATLREKREIQTLDHVGGTHVCTLSPILQGWKPEPPFVHTRKQAAMPELILVPPQFVDLPPPPPTFALPDR